MAKPLLAGNWKMHGTATSAAKLASEIAEISGENPEIIVFPSFVSIPGVVSALSGRKNVDVGAQNLSHYSDGAYTGEISGQMLAELGCTYVLVGHSERRTYNAESNELVAEKFSAAQKSGLTPILCVGETFQQRQDKIQLQVIKAQITAVIEKVGLQSVCDAIIAYEPVWSIGTGIIPKSNDLIKSVNFIKSKFGSKSPKILYGGSVNDQNISQLKNISTIDGFLIGGASQDPKKFIDIIKKMYN